MPSDPRAILPPRPWSMVNGNLEAVVPILPRRRVRIPNEVGEKDRVRITGWIQPFVDPSRPDDADAVEVAWLAEGDRLIAELPLTRLRADVYDRLQVQQDPRPCGFDVIARPRLSPGRHLVRLLGRTASGGGVHVKATTPLVVPLEPVDVPEHDDTPDAACSIELNSLRDTETAPFTVDRGPHTVSMTASLRVRARLDDATVSTVYVRLRGQQQAWYCVPFEEGGFSIDSALDIASLSVGPYEVVLYAATRERALRPVVWAMVEIALPHWSLPEALTPFRQHGRLRIERRVDASPRRSPFSELTKEIRRGAPLLVSGSFDASDATTLQCVFAKVDERRPIPLTVQDDGRRFGGIIDTARFDPGNHEVELRAVPLQGYGYYVKRFPLTVV